MINKTLNIHLRVALRSKELVGNLQLLSTDVVFLIIKVLTFTLVLACPVLAQVGSHSQLTCICVAFLLRIDSVLLVVRRSVIIADHVLQLLAAHFILLLEVLSAWLLVVSHSVSLRCDL